jgi:hypothetical protein
MSDTIGTVDHMATEIVDVFKAASDAYNRDQDMYTDDVDAIVRAGLSQLREKWIIIGKTDAVPEAVKKAISEVEDSYSGEVKSIVDAQLGSMIRSVLKRRPRTTPLVSG